METRYKLAVGILIGVVTPAMILLMGAFWDIARWGGYDNGLLLAPFLLLFVVGHFIVNSATRVRRRKAS